MRAVIVWLSVLCLVQGRVYETSESIIVEVDDERHLAERSVDEEFSDRWCRTRQGNTGSCMSFRECYPFTKQPDFTELNDWLNGTRSTCHYSDSNGRKVYGICCYKGNNETGTEAIDTKQIGRCGSGPRQLPDPVFDETNRIVGGTEAQRGSWPFIISIMKSGRHTCGGTIITQYHILTAAHCVAKMTSNDVAAMSVVIQTHTIKPVDPWSSQAKVRRVTRHKSFNSRTLFNDIAILTLATPIQYTASISPVCLPNIGDTNQYINYEAAVIGWGASREGGNVSPVLQQVKVQVQSNDQCARNYGNDAPGGIIASMICAAYPGKDSCQGDSGGPLLSLIGGQWVQIGVVSWGIGCGKPPYPGVYTRVTSFAQWIQANLQ